jgi:hypothetical protein
MSQPTSTAVPKVTARQRLVDSAILLLATLVAVTPLLLRGPSCGDDFNFHLSSWVDAQRSWLHGILYPHWATGANYGAGEPRFVFYPPLTWMLGAALGLVLPWHLVPLALTFLLLAAIGFASRALAREVLPGSAATLAGCAAIFFGYALYTAYQRTAYGELSGGFWIPLILLFALRDRHPGAGLARRAFDGSTLPLALSIAGAWLSNAPVGVMACYTLAVLALAAAFLGKTWMPILRSAVATPLALGLIAVYLLPAAFEQRWVDIRQAIDVPGHVIEDNWLFHRLSTPTSWWGDHELQYASITAVAMLVLAIAATVFACFRKSLPRAARSYWLPLACIAPVVLFLLVPISEPVWNILPALRFLQFPWRWMVVLEAPMGLFFAAAVWSLRPTPRKMALTLTVLAFLLATAAANRSFFLPCHGSGPLSAVLDPYSSGQGIAGAPEYNPPGTTAATLISATPPGACLSKSLDAPLTGALAQSSCDQVFSAPSLSGKTGAEQFSFSAVISHPGYLILRLRTFPAWQIALNGQSVPSSPVQRNGLIAIPVSPGSVQFTATWRATPDVMAGRVISAVSLLLLSVLAWIERRNKLIQLSS